MKPAPISKRPLWVALLLLASAFAFMTSSSKGSVETHPHSHLWVNDFRSILTELPDFSNELFSTSGACVACHGHDPEGIASVTPEGEDVNVVDAWRASIMANSAKDPYWRAKMRQEMQEAPQHAEETGDFCTKCHAPLGRHAHEQFGEGLYTFDHMLADTAGIDGVSCVACHQLSDVNLGNTHSGDLNYMLEKVAYGPFESPLASPMALESGYTPVYSEHISDAGVCAGCHSLVTNTTDLEGNFTGETFIEQATYHEWLNSIYGEDELNVTCQSCHMPSLGSKSPIVLAAGYDTPPRAPFSKHTFAGANAFMLRLMQQYADTLDIKASEQDFNASINATMEMMQWQSIMLEGEILQRDNEELLIELRIENLAGHKFPSGYPARRAFVQLEVLDSFSGETLFLSGAFDAQGYLLDEDSPFEPHYDELTAENQVQIYEMVMADVEGNPTTVLEQGADYLKDNRLVPLGFTTSHAVYDTTLIVGAALTDPNFNKDEQGNEGTGLDVLTYRIPLNNFSEALLIDAKVYYQSVPPKWTEELFEVDDPLVDHFEDMYNSMDHTPILVKEISLEDGIWVGLEEPEVDPSFLVTADGRMRFTAPDQGVLRVFDLTGRMLVQSNCPKGVQWHELPGVASVLLIHFESNGQHWTHKAYVPK